jgi:hypothetical protein
MPNKRRVARNYSKKHAAKRKRPTRISAVAVTVATVASALSLWIEPVIAPNQPVVIICLGSHAAKMPTYCQVGGA